MKQPEVFPSTLPAPRPKPPIDDHSAEGTFILLFDQAIELASLVNAGMLQVYLKQCEFWQQNAVRYNWAKLQLPPKPVIPMAYTVVVENTFPIARVGSSPLAGPCPDPESDGVLIQARPTDPVGEWLGGWDPWYRVVPGDTTPVGSSLTVSAATLHPAGTFTRRERLTPFGAFVYWEKTA